MGLIQSPELQIGRLELIACESNSCELVDKYDATSGLPSWQAPADRSVRRKGPIPDPKLAGKKSFFVTTKPTDARGVKGIDGNFYPISPYGIGARAGFGIHADKNVPGTAGCIGVVDLPEWVKLQQQLKKISTEGIDRIPLVITYELVSTNRI